MKYTALTGAALIGAVAAKDTQTFAVLRFNGDPIFNGRVDPIVNPGVASPHEHSVFGGSNFGLHATGETMVKSKCSSAVVKGDNSAYWMPRLYFHDKADDSFEAVPVSYANVYYFFDPTDDEIKAFPTGLQILAGPDASTRHAPAVGARTNLDPNNGDVNPVFWTCARTSYADPSWPADSDGTTAGIGCPGLPGQGVGFPLKKCDAFASPLRADVNFPSCYDPSKGLTNYKENMVYPSAKGTSGGKLNCPEGFVHVPRMLFEIFWDTQKFDSRWTPDGKTQPFVLSNGDVTGYSLHADFLAGWDEQVLQKIIDTCDVKFANMDTCPGIESNKASCSCDGDVGDYATESTTAKALPGTCPLSGFQYGAAPVASAVSAVEKAASNHEQEASSPEEDASPAAESPVVEAAPALSSAPAEAAPVCATRTKTVVETKTVWEGASETAAAAKRHLHRHVARHH
ncbi:uncharacterized protein DNG_07260 [Cephalotrichum gorgonifer]|uniref:DUF1996 domain-containing protein n=1 Tax=Cephalotrichum gorgonifer TaxID=2041049 RepID=A0AAE8SX85_9PEZI|nr:uncharacterized protein DNG_07260 [Cephalotrichum gorgonifer]